MSSYGTSVCRPGDRSCDPVKATFFKTPTKSEDPVLEDDFLNNAKNAAGRHIESLPIMQNVSWVGASPYLSCRMCLGSEQATLICVFDIVMATKYSLSLSLSLYTLMSVILICVCLTLSWPPSILSLSPSAPLYQ
ncbi:hypothetical protein KIPB_008197 [Kipferlia bialata]|uniref:Uncharacterized protein n=1 Tax=Kipferlia bialata TaxID=797122 RepID=A0A9K3GL96_9EUKA|nr:hypothetical protein KIPB_008197 [Kipferlia bialata]|eukprot:g8197.t1